MCAPLRSRCRNPASSAVSRSRLAIAAILPPSRRPRRPSDSLRWAVPVNGSDFDPRLLPVYLEGRELLGDVAWFDAHTHIGHNDPDGRKATAEEIIGGLDAAGHQRALVFAMQEPDGYPPANDAVLDAAAASGCSPWHASRPTTTAPSTRRDAAWTAARAGSSCTHGRMPSRSRTPSSRRSSPWLTTSARRCSSTPGAGS